MKSLVLSHNLINIINELGSFNHLTSLIVDDNKVKDVKGLGSLKSLRFLDISQNQIGDITPLRILDNLPLTNITFERNPLPEYVFKDKLNQQFILSMLSPYIAKAVEKYYGGFRQYMNSGILDIELTNEGFKLKVIIETFVGPHNPP